MFTSNTIAKHLELCIFVIIFDFRDKPTEYIKGLSAARYKCRKSRCIYKVTKLYSLSPCSPLVLLLNLFVV